jgi:hypothetical protein
MYAHGIYIHIYNTSVHGDPMFHYADTTYSKHTLISLFAIAASHSKI